MYLYLMVLLVVLVDYLCLLLCFVGFGLVYSIYLFLVYQIVYQLYIDICIIIRNFGLIISTGFCYFIVVVLQSNNKTIDIVFSYLYVF